MELPNKKNDGCGVDEADPAYRIFLDHLREDGNSYIFEMIDGIDGSSTVIKYGDKIGLDDIADPKTPETLESAGSSESSEQTDRSSSSPDSVCRTQQQNTPSQDHDPCYTKFLSHVKLKDQCMVLEWDSNVSVVYEKIIPMEEEANFNGHEIIPYQVSSHQEFDSKIEVQQFDSQIEVQQFDSQIEAFQDRLAKVLGNAYDQNEYEELLRKATERKYVVKFKHLRDQTISYESKDMGLSYLDHHPDLAAKIKSADPPTALKLLRGFFFWLKNLCHQGAYAPWITSTGISLIDDCELSLPLDSLSELKLFEAGCQI